MKPEDFGTYDLLHILE